MGTRSLPHHLERPRNQFVEESEGGEAGEVGRCEACGEGRGREYVCVSVCVCVVVGVYDYMMF